MKTNRLAQTAALLLMAGAATTALALPIAAANVSVDGNLTDWGVTIANNNLSNIQPKTVGSGSSSPACTVPAPQPGTAPWACEDTDDNAGTSGLVGPQYGGQNYDVEFLGAARGTGLNSNTLFVGIANGLRPDNGFSLYAPGDLWIRVNGVQYVVEMGGGIGGTTTTSQSLGALGAYYVLDSNGYTIGVRQSDGTSAGSGTIPTMNASQTVGSIWNVSQGTTFQTAWAIAPTEFRANAGETPIGQASAVYATLNVTPAGQNQHAMIEASIDMTLFGSGNLTIDELRWDPACFNDVLSVTGTMSVPEPSSLALLGLGWMAFAGLRRRSRRLPIA